MRRHRTLTALAAGSMLGLLAPALVTATATAAPDRTPPTVQLDPWAHLVVGSQVDVIHDADGFLFWGADFQIDWTASDASGICAQEVGWSSYDALGSDIDPHIGGPTIFTSVSPEVRTFVAAGLDPFDWQRVEDRFVVKVTDCAGNTSFSNVADSEFGLREDTDPAITYQGRWHTARFDDAAGGTTHTTSKAGASAQVTFTSDGPIALIMETAPSRGEADVYVDSVLRATVDTSSAVTRQRVVVWQDRFPGGTHTLELVNRATQKRPRIDLDAISVCPGDGSCLE